MRRINAYVVLALSLDALLLLVCFFHTPAVLDKSRVPLVVDKTSAGVVVQRIVDAEAASNLQPEDVIVAWGKTRLQIPEALEFLADLSEIGETVPFVVQRGEQTFTTTIRLIPYYESPVRNIIIILFVGVIIWGVGVFVLLSRPFDSMARLLHWSMISFATIIMITWGKISPDSVDTYLSRSLFFVSYAGVVSGLLYFTLMFPRPKPLSPFLMRSIAFIPLTVVSILLVYFHLLAIREVSVERYIEFQRVFDLFHTLILLYAGGGIAALIHSNRSVPVAEERERLRWIMWGLVLGPLPFLVLIVVPQLFSPAGIVPEEYTTIFFIIIPLTMALSVVRYRTFDIEVVINRGVVYGVLTLILVATYIVMVLMATSLIGGSIVFEEYFFIILVTLLIAAVFNPLRDRIQKIVDESLFTTRVNFRNIVRQVSEQLRKVLTTEELFHTTAREICKHIECDAIAGYERRGNRFRRLAVKGKELPEEVNLPARIEKKAESSHAFAVPLVAGSRRADIDISEHQWLREHGVALMIPIFSEARSILAVIMLRPSPKIGSYDEVEFDLLLEVASVAGEVLERLKLQERIFIEKEEQRRLEELNRLKSYFVSSVSHELRMPLTSIKMFAETLRLGRVKSQRQVKEYLEIIEGETNRLARLIENVLDFSKIERGVKEYQFEKAYIQDITARAVGAMRYQFQSQKARLRVSVSKKLPPIIADADAIEEVIINLLSNALKYSTGRKDIELRVTNHRSEISLMVKDKGIGIPKSELPNLFTAFYRVRDAQSAQVGGAGLGLSLVKHIVEAHHGRVEVKSEVGKGSRFTITLPVNHAENHSHR
ncbi:MAG TPA: ATP-binding protein [Bacteroidota bacterium]|nr:ATP-binding protein [Bacteroidota bacterium]